MAKGKKDKPTRKERRAQKKHVLLGDDGEDLDTQLKILGLTTKCITGDGNCLFRALSDQYYGYDKHHKAIRQEVCQYLEQNKDTYQFFVEDDIPFDRYLENMRQDGCFGGHMIIVGFAKLRQVDIKIYQPGMIYVIHGLDEDEIDQQDGTDNEDDETSRQVLHIAYHSWEHYSSVRNIDGPYNGMPEIKDNNDMNSAAKVDHDEGENQDDDADSPDSKEKVILTACPGTNIRKIRRLLRKYKGNPDKVIDALYEQHNDDEEEITNQDTIAPTTTTATSTTDDKENTIDNNNGNTQSHHKTQPDEKEATETTDEARQEKKFDKDSKDIDSPNNDTKAIPEAQLSPSTAPPPPLPAKRLTAQQRKHQAKMRQKEQKREKKQQAANKHVAAKMNSKSTETDSNTNITQQTMKQLYI